MSSLSAYIVPYLEELNRIHLTKDFIVSQGMHVQSEQTIFER